MKSVATLVAVGLLTLALFSCAVTKAPEPPPPPPPPLPDVVSSPVEKAPEPAVFITTKKEYRFYSRAGPWGNRPVTRPIARQD